MVYRTLICAELGQNHEGDYKLLKDLAYSAGQHADIIKLQYWNTDGIYSKEDVRYKANKERNGNLSQHLIFELCKEIKTKLKKQTMVSFFGASIGALADATTSEHIDYLKFASSEFDVFEEYSKKFGNAKVVTSLGYRGISKDLEKGPVYLTCDPAYPSKKGIACIEQMINLKLHGYVSGYSCHEVGIKHAKLAIAFNAFMVEKHFTFKSLKEKSTFRDHIGSMDEHELKRLVEERDRIYYETIDPDHILKINGKRRLKLS